MALITISGYPCSGKSTRANQLKEAFETQLADLSYNGPVKKVVIVSDDSLNLARQAYDDGRNEKPQRASLFTAIQRALTKDTVVIVDGLNYIKGYRYQMHCVARELSVRVATVFVVATPELCREWHAQRLPEQVYTPSTFDNLIQRFEEPSSMVRWDSPLFTVPWNEELPVGDIWRAITAGVIKPPNAGTTAAPKPPSDALQTLERTSSSIVSIISSSQTVAGGGPGGLLQVEVGETRLPLELPARNVTLSELQRVKRQFVAVHKKAITQGATESGDVDWSEEGVARKFVEYLTERWSEE